MAKTYYGNGSWYNTKAEADAAVQNAYMQNQQNQMARTANKTASWQLSQAQEAWDLKKTAAKNSTALASQFLSAWSGSIASSKGVLESLMNSLSSGSSIAANNPFAKQLTDISNMIGEQYKQYQADTGVTQEAMFTGAREEAGARRGSIQAINAMMTPDYAGVEGRAAADVRTQSETQQQAEAKRQMAMGIDPSSGRFGALSKKGVLDTAKNTAVAMNVARRGEKERVGNLAVTSLQNLDPSKMGTMGVNLARGGVDLLKTQGDVAGAAAGAYTSGMQAETARTQAIGNLASAYNTSVTQPMGEMAGYFLGKSAAI